MQDEEEATDKLVKDGWLSGLHKTFITIEQLGSPHMFGVRFKAGGAYPFLKMPCSEVSGLVLESCGYYDQAHLIRDFKSFSGLTPAQYVKERGGDLNHVPLPKRT